jgi:hypothetical protein
MTVCTEVVAKLIFEANHSDEAEDLLREFIADRFEAQEKIIAEQAREIRILEDKINGLKRAHSLDRLKTSQ